MKIVGITGEAVAVILIALMLLFIYCCLVINGRNR